MSIDQDHIISGGPVLKYESSLSESKSMLISIIQHDLPNISNDCGANEIEGLHES